MNAIKAVYYDVDDVIEIWNKLHAVVSSNLSQEEREILNQVLEDNNLSQPIANQEKSKLVNDLIADLMFAMANHLGLEEQFDHDQALKVFRVHNDTSATIMLPVALIYDIANLEHQFNIATITDSLNKELSRINARWTYFESKENKLFAIYIFPISASNYTYISEIVSFIRNVMQITCPDMNFKDVIYPTSKYK